MSTALAALIADSAPIAPPSRLPRVVIAVACGDWKMEVHTSESIRMICAQAKCEAVLPRYMFNDGVARARNNLSAMFLEDKEATHIFFYDSDIVMEPRQFQRLLDAKKPVIGAFYPKKQGILDWVCNFLPNEVPDENGILKVKHAGTGALLIERATLVAFMERHPELIYRGDPNPQATRCDFFPMRAVDGAYLSEDWAFCNAIIADGGCIWIDTRTQLRHVGKIVYPLQFTLSDDEVVDIVFHRYGIWPDHIKTFFASGGKEPGLMGGHRERFVRLWPQHFPVPDLYDGGILNGALDVPLDPANPKAPVVLDLGADYGAFAIFASKRWPGCTVTCYEGRGEISALLEETIATLKGVTATLVPRHVTGATAHELPKANLLKIDLPGMERDILSSLKWVGNRLDEFDAVMVVYEDDTEAFLVAKLMEQTHLLHCWQRLPKGCGIQKFVHRRIEFTAPQLRA